MSEEPTNPELEAYIEEAANWQLLHRIATELVLAERGKGRPPVSSYIAAIRAGTD